MANGNNLLPQSALPLGQTPLQIQAPNTQVSVPNPIDVSNFFNMQAGIQRNVGILQQQEALKQRQQTIDLKNYELMIRETESMLGMLDNAYDGFYEGETAKRSTASAGSTLGDLDMTRARHRDAAKRVQGVVDGTQAQLDQLVKGALASGSMTPEQRFEVTRQMRRAIDDTNNQLKGDREYSDLVMQHRMYSTLTDQIQKVKNCRALGDEKCKGVHVNGAAVDDMINQYNEWTETGKIGGSRVNRLPSNFFDLNKYVFNSNVLADIAADAKIAATETKVADFVDTGQGTLLEATRTIRPGADELAQIIADKYKNNSDAVALWKNTMAQHGLGFEEWMEVQILPHAAPEDKQSVISALGDPVKPNQTVPVVDENISKSVLNELDSEAKTGANLGIAHLTKNGINPAAYSLKELETLGNANLGDVSINKKDGSITIKRRDKDGDLDDLIITPAKLPPAPAGPMPFNPDESGIDSTMIVGNEQAHPESGEIPNKENKKGIYSVREEFEFDKKGNKTNTSRGKSYGSTQLFGDTWNEFVASELGLGSGKEGVKALKEKRPDLDATDPANEKKILQWIENKANEVGERGFKQSEIDFLTKTKWQKPIEHMENLVGRTLSPEIRTFIADAANQHGGVIPGVLDKAMDKIESNDKLDPAQDIDVLTAIYEARVDYLRSRGGKDIDHQEVDSIIVNRYGPLFMNLMQLEAGKVPIEEDIEDGETTPIVNKYY